MKTVAIFDQAYEAHLAQGKLEAEGVASYIADEFAAPWITWEVAGGVKLQVADEDFDRAVEILDLE